MTIRFCVSAIVLALLASCAMQSPVSTKSCIDNPSHLGGLKRDYADSRFGQVHYRVVNPGCNAAVEAPLVALHLSPNSGQVFSAFMPIIGKDRVVMAPDYPGYGMSDAIPGDQKIADYAAAMIDVIEDAGLEGPVDLLGYHTGSGVALEMARQRPGLVRKMILVAVPMLSAEERATGAALPRIPFDTDGEFAKREWQSSWGWRGPGQSEDSVYRTFSEKMRPGTRERGAQAILAYDLAPVLEAATHPILIVRVNDDLWNSTPKALEIRPDATYIELPDYGHGLFDVAPYLMAGIVEEFLDDAERSAQ